METRAFFNTLTFIILFAVVLLAIATSFHTMCGYMSTLERHPTPPPVNTPASYASL